MTPGTGNPEWRRFRTLELLLRLFPRRFRGRYGDEIRAHFAIRHELATRRGLASRAGLWLRTVADLLASAIRERRRSSFLPPRHPRGPAHRAGAGDPMLSTVWYDLRVSARGLLHRPLFTLLAVGTLGLGIGASTAVFSVVEAVLLRPLPYEEPGELIRIYGRFDPESGFDFPRFPLSVPELLDYQTQTRAMQSVGGYTFSTLALSGGDAEPVRLSGANLRPELFTTLRTQPLLGRVFTADDAVPGAAPVVLLSWALWNERFAADPGVVGSEIRLDGTPHQVIGVMPQEFLFPIRASRVWVPMVIDPARPGGRQQHNAQAVARLAPGETLERARAEMARLMESWKADYPEIHTGHYLILESLFEDTVGSVRPALLTLLVAAGLVLLLGCSNVASMLAARGEERTREVALRAAVGAGKGRVLSYLLGESLLLAGAGGALGLVVASLGVSLLTDSRASGIPRVEDVTIDLSVLAVAGALSLATAIVFGLAPAFRAASIRPHEVLRENARGASSRFAGRAALVVVEVALCFVLVLGAGLMIRSHEGLLATDRGFLADDRLVARITLPSQSYTADAILPTFQVLADRLRAVPGVGAVATSGGVPLVSDYGVWDFQIEARPEPGPGAPAWNAAFDLVSPEFFGILGMPIERGRGIEPEDTLSAEPVVVVNRVFVERFLPEQEPLGTRIRVAGDAWEYMRIVGVVADARYAGIDAEPAPRYYGAAAQWTSQASPPPRSRFFTIHAVTDPAALPPALRAAVSEVDPELPVYSVQTLEQTVQDAVARPRFTTRLLTWFGVLALVLGASGTYGVLAYAVARRVRELGIRKALGASSSSMLALVIRQGMIPVGLGVAVGGAVAFVASRRLASQLYGVAPTDPGTWVVVGSVIVVTGIAACLVPALRALRIDPVTALRAE